MKELPIIVLAMVLFMRTSLAAELARFSPAAPEPDTTRYELQVITAKPGKLDALHKWFAGHKSDVLAKHGATSIGYFTSPTSGMSEPCSAAVQSTNVGTSRRVITSTYPGDTGNESKITKQRPFSRTHSASGIVRNGD
jgi:hypothetical protein